jgi:hypothetical protein
MSPSLLEQPKIERAKKHLDDFEAACLAFVKTKPYTVTKQPHKYEGRGRKVEFDPAPPNWA